VKVLIDKTVLPIAVYSVSSMAENSSRFFIVEAIVQRITKPLFIGARNSFVCKRGGGRPSVRADVWK
jgi:hypothetical protein